MEAFNFGELISIVDRKRFWEPYFNKLATFFERLTDSDILGDLKETYNFFYPKYLWQEEKQLEIYFITKAQIIECKYNREGNISIITRYAKDIESIKIDNFNALHHDIELEIHFTNGKTIAFNSNDSNEHWKRRYFKEISQIHKFLLIS